MVAHSKEELVTVMTKEYAKLEKLIGDIDEKLALTPHPEDDITIKDTIAHRVHWNDLFFGWYADGLAGRPVHVPAKGYKWNQLKEYNAKVRQETADQSWDEAKAKLFEAHARLAKFIDERDDKQLYGPRKYDWQGKYPLGRWAESTGPSHYRSAAKYIRQIKKALAD